MLRGSATTNRLPAVSHDAGEFELVNKGPKMNAYFPGFGVSALFFWVSVS